MDTGPSGTGVFYQVMPAVGDDGKNIMKLIPVQMVNGRFVQTQISKPKVDSGPPKALALNIAQAPVQMVRASNVTTTAPQQIVRTPTHLFVNVSPNQAVAPRNSTNIVSKNPLPRQTVSQMMKVRQTAPFPRLVRVPDQPPVAVKPTALPRAQYVPRQNFSPSTLSSVISGQPTAYVSPVTTLGPRVPPPTSSAGQSLKQISVTENKPTCGPTMSKRSKPALKLIQKVSQRPNSPIKWIIEEENTPVPPCLNPLNLPSVTSEILQTVAKRENKNMPSEATTPQTAVGPTAPAKSGLGQETSLVRCNGKLFVVVKKCNLPLKLREETNVSPPKNSELKEVSIPSKDDHTKESTSVPRHSDEVIDLCDDDPHEEVLQTATVSSADEDNVIFVSYIPPKSKSGSTKDVANPPAEKKTTQRSLTSSNCGTGDKNSAAPHRTVRADADTSSANAHGSSAVTMNDDVPSHKDGQQSMDHSSRCSEPEVETLSIQSSTNPTPYLTHPPNPCLVSDHVLRKAFGITADVKIYLERIHVNPARTSKRKSGNTHAQRRKSRLKGREDSCGDLDMCVDVAPDQTSARLHTQISHNQCSHDNRRKTDTHMTINRSSTRPRSHKGTLSDGEEDPGVCYMEPLDEDLPGADVNAVLNLNTKLSRVRRTRKRTMCPCCTPSGLDLTAKSSTKLGGPHKQAWKT